MPAPADRNLLFGILAVQLDFVSKGALVAAMQAWLLDKARPLGDVLRDRGELSPEEFRHLAALVDVHLKRHGDDPARSLAALSSVPPTLRQELAALPDAEVRQTLGRRVAEVRPWTGAKNLTFREVAAYLSVYRIIRGDATYVHDVEAFGLRFLVNNTFNKNGGSFKRTE